MSNYCNHPYHLVDESPWPILASVAGLGLTTGLLEIFLNANSAYFIFSLIFLLIISSQWWRDVAREGSFQGIHTTIVELGLRWGIILFIVSEVFFFVSFFWAFFHRSLRPNVDLGRAWPPKGITPFNPFAVPLLNTIVLLSSGIRVTWRHHALIEANHLQAFWGLVITVILGVYFTFLQAL